MSSTQPSAVLNHAPVGTSIQVAADVILTLIEAERRDAAHASLLQYKQLEQQFISFRRHTMGLHAAEQAKTQEAQRKLVETQTLLAQYQQYVADQHAANTRGLARGQTQPAYIADEQARQGLGEQVAETSAKRRLDELQAVLRDVGIMFSADDNSLRFEAGWASVLAQLEARDCGIMNARRLHEVLGQLTQRLQQDREHIAQLEQRILASEEKKKRLVENYQLELECLRLEISMMHDPAGPANQPSQLPPTTVASNLSQPPAPSTTICDTQEAQGPKPTASKATATATLSFIDLRLVQAPRVAEA